MPRPRQYKDNAEKQAAYRQRHATQMPPREGYLAALARSLHGTLRDAVHAKQSALPPELLGLGPAETLRNLIRYVQAGEVESASLHRVQGTSPAPEDGDAGATRSPKKSENDR